jgi:photosystem II stability/assembly factor-like uncharacterized protein
MKMKKFYVILIALLSVNSVDAQWYQLNSGTSWELTSVNFPDQDTGYIVSGGGGGEILKTTNSGAIWTSQNLPFAAPWSVYFTDANTGYVVGAYEPILKTTDGGALWTSQNSGNSDWLNSVYFLNKDTGYVTDYSNGAVLKTTNGGVLWTSHNTSLASLSSVYFVNPDTGFVAGYWQILETTDGGITWTSQYSGPNVIQSVYFANVDTGYAVGYHGTILRTISAGTSWIQQTSGTRKDLISVYFIDANNGYVVGDSGIILNTTNGGALWTKQNSGTLKLLNSVYFTDMHTGYAVGDSGIILKTMNGGYPLGVNENRINSGLLKIFPNPASDKINIEMSDISQQTILSIQNLDGQQMLNQAIINPITQIDITDLPYGVYFVRVTNDRTVGVGKFIKK